MRRATLLRLESGDQGTFGILSSERFTCFTTELPWRNNEPSKSCIPPGTYTAAWHRSPRFGWTYKLQQVPGRSEILLHSGNYAGDTDRGYISNSHGCILLALKLGTLDKQKAGLMSRVAVSNFNKYMNQDPFLLEIRDVNDPFRSVK